MYNTTAKPEGHIETFRCLHLIFPATVNTKRSGALLLACNIATSISLCTRHSTFPCISLVFHMILATYQINAEGTGYARYSPLPCLLFSSFPLLLTHDGCMRAHNNLSMRLLLCQFFSLLQDKLSHLFSLLTTKELNKR